MSASMTALLCAAWMTQPIKPLEERLPPGAIAPPPRAVACEMSLGVTEEKTADGIYFTATATNLSTKSFHLSAPDACPAGPLLWHGLPTGYDYYQGCNKGACARPRPPITWTVRPRKTVELGGIVVRPKGGMCVQPLRPGVYTLTFTPPQGSPKGVALCGPAGATIQVAGPTSRKVVAKPAVKCPPMKACSVACDGPPARDQDGCPTCGCEATP